jgi:hypothetical protein
LESRFDSGTTPSFLVFDVTGPLAYTIPITDHPHGYHHESGTSPSLSVTPLTGLFSLFTTPSMPTTAPTLLAAYGSIGLDAPEDNVIPFASLTPEIVIGWVQEKLGGEEKVAEIEAALQAQIDQQRTPTTAAGVPWS